MFFDIYLYLCSIKLFRQKDFYVMTWQCLSHIVLRKSKFQLQMRGTLVAPVTPSKRGCQPFIQRRCGTRAPLNMVFCIYKIREACSFAASRILILYGFLFVDDLLNGAVLIVEETLNLQ